MYYPVGAGNKAGQLGGAGCAGNRQYLTIVCFAEANTKIAADKARGTGNVRGMTEDTDISLRLRPESAWARNRQVVRRLRNPLGKGENRLYR